MDVRELVGAAVAVLVLAGLSMAIVNGGSTAKIISASAGGFADVIKAATLR